MTTQPNPTFTAADVAELAALALPFLKARVQLGMTVEDAVMASVARAEAQDEADFTRRITRTHALAGVLAGTYDEFHAEA